MKKKNFYFAKINIHGNIFSPNLDELIEKRIPEVIKEVETIKLKSWNWSFTDLNEEIIDERRIMYGNVTKSKFPIQKIRDGNKTYHKKSNIELAETAFFVYDLKNEILVFETNSHISLSDFIRFFTELLSQDIQVGKVIIKTIPEEFEIEKYLISYDKVTKITFSLIHPNPGKKSFNRFNNMINESGLKELEITMKNTEEGVDLKLDGSEIKNEDIKEGISLVESGYGDVEIRAENHNFVPGKRKKLKKVVTRKSFSSKKSIKKIPFRGEDPTVILNRIVGEIKNLFL